MQTEIGPSNGRNQTLPLETKHSKLSNAGWRTKQLIALAEVFREPLTPECLAMYVESLSDLSDDQIRLSIRRAARELNWFPKIAELRELAGVTEQDARRVEADAAWTFVNEYLRKWGVDRIPFYSGGKRIYPPGLPPRVDYAVRRIGGLSGLNQIRAESRPFMYKDFCESYALAPIAESSAPQLQKMFGEQRLLGQAKLLSAGISIESPASKSEALKTALETRSTMRPQSVPESLTDAQIRDRREILRQQTDRLTKRRKSSFPAGRCELLDRRPEMSEEQRSQNR